MKTNGEEISQTFHIRNVEADRFSQQQRLSCSGAAAWTLKSNN